MYSMYYLGASEPNFDDILTLSLRYICEVILADVL